MKQLHPLPKTESASLLRYSTFAQTKRRCVATATAIVNNQLFLGQSQAFFDAVTALAKVTDAARREPSDDD